jgi:two-component system sensor kinase FixL
MVYSGIMSTGEPAPLATSSLGSRLEFETLLADLSSRFINLPPADVDRQIEGAQRRICEHLGLDMSSLWQWSTAACTTLVLTHLCQLQDGPPIPERMAADEYFPWVQKQALAGRTTTLCSMAELPAEAARDGETYRHLGIKSALVIPLSVGGEKLVGAVSFNSLRAERDWPDTLVGRLQLVAQVFANALARKHSDEALRESEARLSLAADAAEAGLWILDYRTRAFWATERARAIFGYSPDDVVSLERVESSVHPDDWDLVRGAIERSARAGEPLAVEYRIALPGTDRVRWISSRGRPQLTPTGEPERLMGISIDVTERRRAEEALRTSEARLSAGAELAGLGFYEVDFGAGSMYIDDRMHDVCGISPDLEKGLQPLEFWMEHLHPDDRARVLGLREQLQDGRLERFSLEYRYLHPARGERWIQHVAGARSRGAGGRAARTYGVLRDITPRKKAEEELARLRTDIWHAHRVAQTGAIAASLAHELNQPLAAILSNAQAGVRLLAGQDPDLDEIREILTDIVHDDKRAADVIVGLRAMLRRKGTQRERLNLATTMRDVLALARSELLAHAIEVELRADGDFPLSADRGQIQQVMLNLVTNAIEAMADQPSERRRLEISLESPAAGTVLLAVRDRGRGIPEDEQTRVFDAFWTTKEHGMGIGLPICRTIIESHGGHLWFANNEDYGVTFFVSLPVSTHPDPIEAGGGQRSA